MAITISKRQVKYDHGTNIIITWPDLRQVIGSLDKHGELHDVWVVHPDGTAIQFCAPMDQLSVFQPMFEAVVNG